MTGETLDRLIPYRDASPFQRAWATGTLTHPRSSPDHQRSMPAVEAYWAAHPDVTTRRSSWNLLRQAACAGPQRPGRGRRSWPPWEPWWGMLAADPAAPLLNVSADDHDDASALGARASVMAYASPRNTPRPDPDPLRVGAASVYRAAYLCRPDVPAAELAREARRSVSDTERAASAGNARCPESQIVAAARHDNPMVRTAAFSNPSIPAAALPWAADDPDLTVRVAAGKNPAVFHHDLVDMFVLRSPVGVALNPACTPDVLARIARRGSVALPVALHPACNVEVVVALAGGSADCQQAAAAHPLCPPDVASRLAVADDVRVKASLAANEFVPDDVRAFAALTN